VTGTDVAALVGKTVFTTKVVAGAAATEVVATGAVDVVARFVAPAGAVVIFAGSAIVTVSVATAFFVGDATVAASVAMDAVVAGATDVAAAVAAVVAADVAPRCADELVSVVFCMDVSAAAVGAARRNRRRQLMPSDMMPDTLTVSLHPPL